MKTVNLASVSNKNNLKFENEAIFFGPRNWTKVVATKSNVDREKIILKFDALSIKL